MPKKMKFERAMARDARKMPPPPGDYGAIPPGVIPHEAITDAPTPSATAAMVEGGQDVVRGNSNAAPLTPTGHRTVQHVGSQIASLGGVDKIVSSDATRTQQTAQAVQGADPKRPPVSLDTQMQSRSYGQMEGEPVTPKVKKFLADLIRKYPDYKIPGQGAMTNRPGESFNEFRIRVLTAVRGYMQMLAENPIQSIAVPKHSQVSKLVKAWVAAGLPDDLSVDDSVMAKEDDSPHPGEIEKFSPDAEGNWTIVPFDAAKEQSLPKGAIYFIEHGETPATLVKSQKVSSGQKARAQIITAIRAGDWNGALSAARTAKGTGIMTDAEIEQAIDESIPEAAMAANTPPHLLLPMATAASPAKRAGLMPLLNQKFGDLSTVDPHGAQQLQAHIARL